MGLNVNSVSLLQAILSRLQSGNAVCTLNYVNSSSQPFAEFNQNKLRGSGAVHPVLLNSALGSARRINSPFSFKAKEGYDDRFKCRSGDLYLRLVATHFPLLLRLLKWIRYIGCSRYDTRLTDK